VTILSFPLDQFSILLVPFLVVAGNAANCSYITSRSKVERIFLFVLNKLERSATSKNPAMAVQISQGSEEATISSMREGERERGRERFYCCCRKCGIELKQGAKSLSNRCLINFLIRQRLDNDLIRQRLDNDSELLSYLDND
jgi:hypothetical protein